MRYFFVAILTLYINSSRAYVYMPTHARSTCTEERLEKNAENARKRGIEETKEEKEKRNARREIYC